MHVHRFDRGIGKELVCYREHEPTATALLKTFLREGMTILDIGANIGYYALLEARSVGPSGRVVAVEPEPRNAALLRRNVQFSTMMAWGSYI